MNFPGDAALRFPDVTLQISSEFGGLPKKLPGQIGNLGTYPNRNFSKGFFPGVSVSLPLSVSPNLFPCVRSYLFRNLCFFLSIFCASLCIPIWSFWCLRLSVSICLFVSLYLSDCLGLSLFVSIYPCLSFVSIALRLFVSLCLFLRVRVCLFGNVCLYLFLSLSVFFLRLFLRVGSQRWTYFRVAAYHISPL